MDNETKWVLKRHATITKLVKPPIRFWLRHSYGFDCCQFKLEDKPYLILSNHQTGMDQFFISLIFDKPIYYIMRDDLYALGIASKFIKWAVRPIAKNKVAKDTSTIRNSIEVAKEGGNIGLFAEGNLTYSGCTEYVSIATAKFVKLLKLPLIFVNIKGGFGVFPRWANKIRKGKIEAKVVKVLQVEDYIDMSTEQLYQEICDNLYNDDVLLEKAFKSKRRAEYLEVMAYVCPKCGISHFISKGNVVECKNCGFKMEYGEDLRFKQIDANSGLPFETCKQWYDYQKNYINNFNIISIEEDKPLFSDRSRVTKVVIPESHRKVVARNVVLSFFSDKIVIANKTKRREFALDDIYAMAILGRNKLKISYKEQDFIIISPKRFNALKYTQMFYHYKNTKNCLTEDFLGL